MVAPFVKGVEQDWGGIGRLEGSNERERKAPAVMAVC